MDSTHTQMLTTGVCQHSSRTLAKTKRIGRRSLPPETHNSPKMPPRKPYSTESYELTHTTHLEHPRVSLKCFCNAACCTRLVNMAHFSPFVSLSFFSDAWPPREMQTWVLRMALHIISKMLGIPAAADVGINKRNTKYQCNIWFSPIGKSHNIRHARKV